MNTAKHDGWSLVVAHVRSCPRSASPLSSPGHGHLRREGAGRRCWRVALLLVSGPAYAAVDGWRHSSSSRHVYRVDATLNRAPVFRARAADLSRYHRRRRDTANAISRCGSDAAEAVAVAAFRPGRRQRSPNRYPAGDLPPHGVSRPSISTFTAHRQCTTASRRSRSEPEPHASTPPKL